MQFAPVKARLLQVVAEAVELNSCQQVTGGKNTLG